MGDSHADIEYLDTMTRVTWPDKSHSELPRSYSDGTNSCGDNQSMSPVSHYYKGDDVYCCFQTKELPPTCGLYEVYLTTATRIYRFSPGQKPVLVNTFWYDVSIESIESSESSESGEITKFHLRPMSHTESDGTAGYKGKAKEFILTIDLRSNRVLSIFSVITV